MEKEWRENLQKQAVSSREEIAKLRAEVTHVTELKSALKQLQRENDDLRRSCTEQEKASYFRYQLLCCNGYTVVCPARNLCCLITGNYLIIVTFYLIQALVELGDHLSKSKVKAEELRHTADMTKENKWVSDKETVSCQQCKKNFSVSRRRVSLKRVIDENPDGTQAARHSLLAHLKFISINFSQDDEWVQSGFSFMTLNRYQLILKSASSTYFLL